MKTLLVIEDHTDIRETTVELLETLGFTTLGASDGKIGLQMFYNFKPDLVFCDVYMPDISGYEVLIEIRKVINFQHFPFYFISALTEPTEVEKGMQLGATGYIKKPYSEQDLLTCLYKEFPHLVAPG